MKNAKETNQEMNLLEGGPDLTSEPERRKFLASCGRFALVTPPVISALMTTTLTSQAIARSGGFTGHNGHSNGGGHPNNGHSNGWGHPNNGYGNGAGDGIPGHSGKNHGDKNR